MHLTKHTDFALRTLLYLAARGERVATIDEVAAAFAINRHHLGKVVQELVERGYIESPWSWWRAGAREGSEADQPRAVVRDFEPHLDLLATCQ